MQATKRLVMAVLALLAAGGALAAEDLAAAAKACRAESDDSRRLACYDGAVDRTTGSAARAAATAGAAPSAAKPAAVAAATAAPTAAATAPAPPSASTATVTAPATPAAQDNFGRERQMAYEEDKRREEASKATGELRATILEIQKRMDGLMTFTLDNGQVWRQTVPQHYALRQGMPVRLYYSRWRAYRLTNERLRGFIQVERVR